MTNRFLSVTYGTSGKSRLITIQIPSGKIDIIQYKNGTLEAYGIKGQSLETILIGAKASIYMHETRLSGVMSERIMQEYKQLMVCLDDLVTQHNAVASNKLNIK